MESSEINCNLQKSEENQLPCETQLTEATSSQPTESDGENNDSQSDEDSISENNDYIKIETDSQDDPNVLQVPSEECLDNWCKNKKFQLEKQKLFAMSRSRLVQEDNETKEEADEQSGEDIVDKSQDVATAEKSCLPPELEVKFVSRCSFDDDLFYFEVNKHPSIQDMIDISTETSIPYEKIYARFTELRLLNKEVCTEDDTCQRVSKYFNSINGYTGSLTISTVSVMHYEFKKISHLGPMPNISFIHLIVEKLNLLPFVVRTCYFKWYMRSHCTESNMDSIIFEEQKVYQAEIERQPIPEAIAPDEHDYVTKPPIVRDLKTESLLRIIRKRPEMTVSEAMTLTSIYNVDLKRIHKLVQNYQLDQLNMHKSRHEDSHVRRYPIRMRSTRPEMIHITRNSLGWKERERIAPDPDCPSLPSNSPTANSEDNQEVLINCSDSDFEEDLDILRASELYEDYVDQSDLSNTFENVCNGKGVMNEPDSNKNQFPGDYEYFAKNRHPSIQEMIDISKTTGTKYRQVFYRFRDLRCSMREACPSGDDCRKVLKFFALRAAYNGVLNGATANRIYELFNKFGPEGKVPNIGYTHLVAAQVDLPPFIIREQYKEWYLEKTNDKETESEETEKQRLDNLRIQNLEDEYKKSSDLSYERLVHLAKKYDTTQKFILNFFDSQERNMPKLEQEDERYVLVDCDDASIPPANELVIPDASSIVAENSELKEEVEVEKNDSQEMNNCFYETSEESIRDLLDTSSLKQTSPSKPSTSESVSKASKLRLSTRKPCAKRRWLSPTASKRTGGAKKKGPKVDEKDIDVVGISSADSDNERADSEDYNQMYHFPGDSKYFQSNRHPSILEMIQITHEVGVSYEQVYFRFKHLRKLTNVVCKRGDTCQKVELFSQADPDLNGVLDENTLGFMHGEFELLCDLGYHLPLGYIHSIMETVKLPSRVVRSQYEEWYKIRRGFPKGPIPNTFDATTHSPEDPKQEEDEELFLDDTAED